MAKKSRRNRARGKVAETSRQPDARPAQQKAQPSAAKAQVMAASLQPVNYDYVKSDLVRIAVIAGVLLLILIMLTFVPALKS
ncbi:MAG: hypothetical protein NT177_01350 [Chloroflexi bacterium]|jgi:hypothetical protein|nr:hypothetical protein [Chloroflexota bacterium]